ncbi:MAG: HAMP domain-containing histidine kinase [Methanophagales archaeon]|nr:HAMP domain-containing histidine kinase [Methanophagales archaeon]
MRRLETIQKEELELKTLNVYPLFASCAIDAVKTRYTEKEVEIRSESRDVIVRGNELLEQVFYNILDNAVKYNSL